jgi:predicted HTH domain antitoxin
VAAGFGGQIRRCTMQIIVNVPKNLPDATQSTPQQFEREAKMAMAVKLFEMKRLSSGMAASLVEMSRVQFLGELHRFGVAVIDMDDSEIAEDIINA